MSAERIPDQADFDLAHFVDMFDEALSSDDPRVVNALRQLMMMVILTKPETSQSWNDHRGPLRRMMEDINHLHRRIETLEQRTSSSEMRYGREAGFNATTMSSAIAAQQKMDADIAMKLAHKINSGFTTTETKNLLCTGEK